VIPLLRTLTVWPPCALDRHPPHRWRRRLVLVQRPAHLPEITIIEMPADHVRRDLACALRVKLLPGRELKTWGSAAGTVTGENLLTRLPADRRSFDIVPSSAQRLWWHTQKIPD
jgi:hypothetical protein